MVMFILQIVKCEVIGQQKDNKIDKANYIMKLHVSCRNWMKYKTKDHVRRMIFFFVPIYLIEFNLTESLRNMKLKDLGMFQKYP